MKVIDHVTSPGGTRANEDRLGHAGGLAWVLDGATDLERDAFLPAPSDVLWLVDRLGDHLTERGTQVGDDDPADLLRSLSGVIARELQDWGFPADRIHPTCSVGLLISTRDELRMARIGDPTCLAIGTAGTAEVSTAFFGRREAEAIARGRTGGLDDETNRRGIIERRQQYIEGVLEESVFSGHPKAGLRIRTAILEPGRFDHVLLCTDGFARAVVDYNLYPDWPTLLDRALVDGLGAIVDQIRSYENENESPARNGNRRPAHFKKSDDVTAILVRT
ncbi:protein phosphatase 2C domain-containing protein [Streptomyces sp. SL13]|uniref:Protein phosphatase 2C domain-containing protein n=1 Tax=Streptantibioticus silvisoli TaxID=2705255 RepID=A0AA90KIY5_9ACTN|nr:protein phosphatase 2C domain-containing protein [Streptantibioticus silvisoli]MDI5973875.1 protein phosphatase 2C domain-containing protein [Streptantibioticus silvisoli]